MAVATGEPTEDSIIRTRLITRTQVANVNNAQTPLYKLTRRYVAFCQAAMGEDKVLLGEAYQAFLKELAIFELQFQRLEAVKAANYREQAQYAADSGKLDENIETMQKEMLQLKAQLEQARVERNHKGEYEIMRKLCMDHPQRSQTRKEIGTLEKELRELELQSDNAASILELRKKQFALLLHAADELQKELEEDAACASVHADPVPMET
mmetsp:Transcript_35415/g.67781  ORF Transcript_35415/g.67781 Transcript_35415/m.67781 type:complete len:210 (+) Transcript_35415:72-701(+)